MPTKITREVVNGPFNPGVRSFPIPDSDQASALVLQLVIDFRQADVADMAMSLAVKEDGPIGTFSQAYVWRDQLDADALAEAQSAGYYRASVRVDVAAATSYSLIIAAGFPPGSISAQATASMIV